MNWSVCRLNLTLHLCYVVIILANSYRIKLTRFSHQSQVISLRSSSCSFTCLKVLPSQSKIWPLNCMWCCYLAISTSTDISDVRFWGFEFMGTQSQTVGNGFILRYIAICTFEIFLVKHLWTTFSVRLESKFTERILENLIGFKLQPLISESSQ